MNAFAVRVNDIRNKLFLKNWRPDAVGDVLLMNWLEWYFLSVLVSKGSEWTT